MERTENNKKVTQYDMKGDIGYKEDNNEKNH